MKSHPKLGIVEMSDRQAVECRCILVLCCERNSFENILTEMANHFQAMCCEGGVDHQPAVNSESDKVKGLKYRQPT